MVLDRSYTCCLLIIFRRYTVRTSMFLFCVRDGLSHVLVLLLSEHLSVHVILDDTPSSFSPPISSVKKPFPNLTPVIRNLTENFPLPKDPSVPLFPNRSVSPFIFVSTSPFFRTGDIRSSRPNRFRTDFTYHPSVTTEIEGRDEGVEVNRRRWSVLRTMTVVLG